MNHTHGICEDADDSLEVFHKHHTFLLSRMLKGEENVQWTETNVFQHLCETFPVRAVDPDRVTRMAGNADGNRRITRRSKPSKNRRRKTPTPKTATTTTTTTRRKPTPPIPLLYRKPRRKRYTRSSQTSRMQDTWRSGN